VRQERRGEGFEGEERGGARLISEVKLLNNATRDKIEDGEEVAVPVAALDGLERHDDHGAVQQALSIYVYIHIYIYIYIYI